MKTNRHTKTLVAVLRRRIILFLPTHRKYSMRPAEMAPGFRVTGHRVSDFGQVGSRVSVSDPVYDPVLSFTYNMCIYRAHVQYSMT